MLCMYAYVLTYFCNIYPIRPPATPDFGMSGFCAETHLGMTVIFHVLLQVDLWDYEKRKSRVCICIGRERLGDWRKAYVMTCAK